MSLISRGSRNRAAKFFLHSWGGEMILAGGIIFGTWGAAERFAGTVSKWQNGQGQFLPSLLVQPLRGFPINFCLRHSHGVLPPRSYINSRHTLINPSPLGSHQGVIVHIPISPR